MACVAVTRAVFGKTKEYLFSLDYGEMLRRGELPSHIKMDTMFRVIRTH
jgi:hypothetical protein